MPDTTFNLHWYEGPAHINGVEFTNVHVSEHADSDGPGVIKSWEGTASVPKRSAPTITAAWLEEAMQQPVEVRLEGDAVGRAYITGAALHNDNGRERWSVDFTGTGPSPWVKGGA